MFLVYELVRTQMVFTRYVNFWFMYENVFHHRKAGVANERRKKRENEQDEWNLFHNVYYYLLMFANPKTIHTSTT